MKLRDESQLRSYQRYMVRQILRKPNLLLAVDMGLGKTAATLTALRTFWKQFDERKVLVVAPLRVATDTWPDEIAVWRHTRRIPYTVICGTPLERRRALKNKRAFIHIINKENLQWLWKELRNGEDWNYDVLVIDEASMLKEGKKRTRREGTKKDRPLSRFGILAKARHKTRRVIELTGTPAPEGVHNLWGLCYILDLGQRLGTSRTAFEKRWFESDYMGWNLTPRPGAQEEIVDRMRDVMVSLRAEDHLELPPIITTPHTDVRVRLPKSLMKEYRKFERELYTEQFDVEAVNKGVLVNKLLQWANGSIYRERGNDIHVHDLKIDALAEMLESFQGAPALLAYSFKFDAARIKHRFGKKCVLLEEGGKNVLKDWNKGKIKLLVAHPASLGHGTNLQYGGCRLIWYGLTQSGELYQQMNKRLPRSGQVSPHVFIYHIIAENTWDERVMEMQAHKSGVESAIREAARVRRKQVLAELREEGY